jgi:hypothetical protein
MNRKSNIDSIYGTTSSAWAGAFHPTSDRMKIQLRDNFIKTDINFFLGTKKTIYTKIDKISSVELGEGRLWWLLIISIFTVFFLIGIIFIILFFIVKVKWLTIYTDSFPLVISYDSDQQAEQFRDLILQRIER